jgi:hypothetical protein
VWSSPVSYVSCVETGGGSRGLAATGCVAGRPAAAAYVALLLTPLAGLTQKGVRLIDSVVRTALRIAKRSITRGETSRPAFGTGFALFTTVV